MPFRTREEVARALAVEDQFKQLAPDRQKAVFNEAVNRLGLTEEPTELTPPSPSPARQFLNAIFTPSRLVGETVSKASLRPAQLTHQALRTSIAGEMLSALSPGLNLMRTSPPEATAQLAGNIASAPVDPTTYAFGGVTRIPNLVGRIGASAVLGAINPYLHSEQANPLDAILGGTLGAGFGAVTKYTPQRGLEVGLEDVQRPFQELGLGRPSTIQNPNVPRDLMFTRIRNRLLNAPRIASREFQSGLQDLQAANPGTMINAQEELARANTFQAQNAHFSSMLENSIRQAPISETQRGIVRSLFDHPESAQNLSLEQAQFLKQVFKQSLKQKFDRVSPEYVGAHLDMLDLFHSLRARELEAFPQFKLVLKGYRDVLSSFRLVANALKEGNIESAVLGDFNNRGLLIKAFNQLATPDTVKLVGRLQSATHLQDLFQKLGIAGAIGTAGAVGAGVAGRPIIRFLTGQ